MRRRETSPTFSSAAAHDVCDISWFSHRRDKQRAVQSVVGPKLAALRAAQRQRFNLTFAYVIGLEHTGHHLWESLYPTRAESVSFWLYNHELDFARGRRVSSTSRCTWPSRSSRRG